MTTLILVRHGQTVWHQRNRYAGRSDVPLTELGHRQADRLGAWAAVANLDALWCSPLSRARDTATAVAAATGLAVQYDDRLRELDFGEAEGLTTDEMAERFPDRLEAFRNDPAADHLPGGEFPAHAADRVVGCFADLRARSPEGRVMVIGHTTAFRLALCRVLGIALSEYRRIFPALDNAATTEIELHGGWTSLLTLNAPVPAPLESAGTGEPADNEAVPPPTTQTAESETPP